MPSTVIYGEEDWSATIHAEDAAASSAEVTLRATALTVARNEARLQVMK
ncbi:MAG: hypothetical protein MZW92_39645 [Comamonadaceae bacterium]|nr:hypothetical protein [Comamonadaceae bacterium]